MRRIDEQEFEIGLGVREDWRREQIDVEGSARRLTLALGNLRVAFQADLGGR
jgi:hypothetical protein